jgi:hypothetical protein
MPERPPPMAQPVEMSAEVVPEWVRNVREWPKAPPPPFAASHLLHVGHALAPGVAVYDMDGKAVAAAYLDVLSMQAMVERGIMRLPTGRGAAPTYQMEPISRWSVTAEPWLLERWAAWHLPDDFNPSGMTREEWAKTKTGAEREALVASREAATPDAS